MKQSTSIGESASIYSSGFNIYIHIRDKIILRKVKEPRRIKYWIVMVLLILKMALLLYYSMIL